MLDLGLIWASPINGLPPFGGRGHVPGRNTSIHDSVETCPVMTTSRVTLPGWNLA